jgi:hypothetical protein
MPPKMALPTNTDTIPMISHLPALPCFGGTGISGTGWAPESSRFFFLNASFIKLMVSLSP